MSDPSLFARQLERYRKLLYGATDPLLIEGLRKLIAELEIKVAAPSVPRDAATPPDGEPDRLGPAS
jgi:hypothetical protein